MCVVCILINKDQLKPIEGMSALWELTLTEDDKLSDDEMRHIQEVYAQLELASRIK